MPSDVRRGPAPPRVRWTDWLAVFIVAAGVWAYGNSLSGVFVLDDIRAIIRNPTIRTLWPLSVPLSPPGESTVSGRPLANLSFAINYAMAPAGSRDGFEPARDGRDPAQTERFLANARGYHLANLAIHVCVALLVFGIVRRTLLTATLRPVFGDAAAWLAVATATIWVVHPLTTEAVTYVVQRVESLVALWYALTLYGAIRAAEGPRGRWWSALAVTACACGMAIKEVMVTAPLAVAAWDAVFHRDGWGRSRVRLLAALAATWAISAVLVSGESRGPSINLDPGIVWRYLVTQASIILHYVRLTFVPAPLVFLYDWPLTPTWGTSAVPLAVVAAAVLASAVAVITRRTAGFAGAVFFLVLAPTSSVLPIVTEVAAEHRMYLPLAALVAVVVCGTYWLVRMFPGPPRVKAVAAAVATLAAVAWLGLATRARNLDYGSETRLWRTAVDARPADARSRVALGSALAADGTLAEAETHLLAAVQLAPGDPVARVRLGGTLLRQGKADEALAQFEAALALRPDDVDALRFAAEAYTARREDARAADYYTRALDQVPGDVEVALRLAALLASSRDLGVRNAPRALDLAERVVQATGRRDPRAVEVWSVALAANFRWRDAAAAAREAAGMARSYGDTRRAAVLDYRASAYDQAATQGFRPLR